MKFYMYKLGFGFVISVVLAAAGVPPIATICILIFWCFAFKTVWDLEEVNTPEDKYDTWSQKEADRITREVTKK